MNLRESLILLLPLLCLLNGIHSRAATVYKTVDENGVVTFSDTPPATEPAEEVQIDVQEGLSPEASAARLEEMRETTDRMAADRREREKHRAELRETQARSAQVSAEPPRQERGYPETLYRDYYPVYPPYYRPPHHYPGHPPGYRPRPEHPVARPPIRPPVAPPGSSNSQLMRPLVSPRR
jgi:hypothetical protein